MRPIPAAAALVALTGSLAGCGFVGASDVSHNKPSGFVLRGHVSVPAAADSAPAGSTCKAPASLADITAGTPVKILDPGGKEIALGSLNAGVIARPAAAGETAASCDFPFHIPGVPGGVTTYGISIDGRSPQMFPAKSLRQDQPAAITLTS